MPRNLIGGLFRPRWPTFCERWHPGALLGRISRAAHQGVAVPSLGQQCSRTRAAMKKATRRWLFYRQRCDAGVTSSPQRWQHQQPSWRHRHHRLWRRQLPQHQRRWQRQQQRRQQQKRHQQQRRQPGQQQQRRQQRVQERRPVLEQGLVLLLFYHKQPERQQQ